MVKMHVLQVPNQSNVKRKPSRHYMAKGKQYR